MYTCRKTKTNKKWDLQNYLPYALHETKERMACPQAHPVATSTVASQSVKTTVHADRAFRQLGKLTSKLCQS